MTTHGTFTFDTQNGADADEFLYTDPLATDATLPQTANTARRWCHDTNDTTSSDVGPTSGAGGSPDGYIYTEASSPGAFDDVFTMEFDTTLDASAEQWQFNFKTNQRGDDNNVVCQLQINENGGGWVDVGSSFGGSGDSDKVNSAGTQIWSSRSVDLSNAGANNDASTRVRIELTFPASGTSWHNDYGIDEIQIVGTVLADYEQEGFRWRNDDDNEVDATWRQNQDVDDSVGKETNIRLRVLTDNDLNPDTHQATLQYKRDDEAATEWTTI